MTKNTSYRKDDFLLPDGTPDIDKLRQALEAANPSPEEMLELAERAAKKSGKSMDDILIECIQSGELTESEIAEAMEMLGQMPLSRRSDVTN